MKNNDTENIVIAIGACCELDYETGQADSSSSFLVPYTDFSRQIMGISPDKDTFVCIDCHASPQRTNCARPNCLRPVNKNLDYGR